MIEKIGAIARGRNIVGPFKIEAERFVGSQAEEAALDREMEFFFPHLQGRAARRQRRGRRETLEQIRGGGIAGGSFGK